MIDLIDIVSYILPLSITITSIYNLITLKEKSTTSQKPDNLESILTILIPARNEELNINTCIMSIRKHLGYGIKIIVLDDNSTDGTRRKLEDLKTSDSNLEIVEGDSIPKGWKGKTWAMYQLILKAKSEYVMFIDADVRFISNEVSDLIKTILNEKTLYSLIPRQTSINFWVDSFANFYLVWWPTSILALRFLQKRFVQKSAVSVGQILVGETKLFRGSNGLQKIKDSIIEDVAMARNAMRNKYFFKNIYIPSFAVSNTYSSLQQSIEGYARSFYLINKDLPSFIFNLLIPILLLAIISLSILGVISWGNILLIVANIFIFSLISSSNFFVSLIAFIPNLFLLIYTASVSVVKYYSGNYIWKGRVYEK